MNRRSTSEPAPQTLRDRIRETTVQAILTAAEGLFADAGLHAARMDEIATRAGVSVGTLYNHFEDRDALLAGLLDARRSDLIAAVDMAIAGAAKRPFRERLRAMLVALLTHCEQHRQFLHIVLQREVVRSGQSTDTMRELHGRIDKVMKQGLRDNALRPETADLCTVFLLGMVRALVIRAVVLGGDDGSDRDMVVEADRVLDAFLHGLGGRNA